MPDLGLTKAIRAAVRTGAKGAKVLRPAEEELIAREAAKAPAPVVPEPQLKTATVEPTIDVPGAATEEVIPPPQAPDAPRLAPVEPAPDAPPPKSPAPAEPAPAISVEQARAISTAKMEDFASTIDETHMPNFDVIHTGDDIKATIAQLAESSKAEIEAARGAPVTHAELEALAHDYDSTVDAVQKMLSYESGGELTRAAIVGARKFIVLSATKIKQLSDKHAANKATPLEQVQLARQVQLHNALNPKVMKARADWGRMGHAFAVPVGGDAAQLARIEEILKAPGSNLKGIAKAVSRTNSVAGITKAIKAGLFKRSYLAAQGFINHVFVNGILSGPVTHARNLIGNVLMPAANMAELSGAAGVGVATQKLGKVLQAVTVEESAAWRLGRFLSAEEHVQFGEASANLHGMLSSLSDAWRLAKRALSEGTTLADQVKYDTGHQGGITKQFPSADNVVLANVGLPHLAGTNTLGDAIRALEDAIGLPTRALGAQDEFFKMMAYRGYAEQQAFLHVQQQVGNGSLSLENAAFAARQFMENLSPEVQAAAEDWARQMTLQSPLGTIGQGFQLALRRVPALTLIAPFIRTPTNIFKEGIARSPLSLFSARFWNAVRKGGRDRDLALTRFALGSATSAYVAHQVVQGNITGAGPQQPEAKQLWEANGRRSYSIKVGDTWHSYMGIEPIASVIGITADFVEIQSYLADDPEVVTNEDQEAYKAAGLVIAAIMNNTGNKTFMKGIADFVELTNDPTRNIVSWTNQMGASMVPYSAALRSIRNVEDPYLREAWTLLDKIKDNTPGYSKDLPPRLGLFGEPREKNSGSILGAMSPLPESKQKYDPVVKELVDVMQKTRLVPATMPGKNIDGMRLTAKEYADYVRIARREPIIGGDRTYYDELQRTIETEAYQDATSQGRYEMLKAVQNMVDTLARAPNGPLEQQNPEYAERITNWRIEQDRLRHGEQ